MGKQTKPKIKMTWENIVKHNILTQTNVEIVLHPAKYKTKIGAKGSSKTYGELIAIILEMTNDPNANAVVFKKFKTNASTVLAGYFNKAYNDLKEAGFDLPEFRVRRNRVYCLRRSKSTMDKNTFVAFGSLEDPSGTSDSLAPNYGYFSKVFIDEVLERRDLKNGKIPDKEQYDQDIEVINSNLSRHTDSWNSRHPEHPRSYSLTATCNPWTTADEATGHPELVECEKIFPEEKFIDFVLGFSKDEINGNEYLVEKEWDNIEKRLLENTSMAIYHEEKDHLVVRNTTFNNPTFTFNKDKLKRKLRQVKAALFNGWWNNLTVILGFCHQADFNKEMLVYDMQDEDYAAVSTTYEDLIEKGYRPKRATFSIDIDTSRVYTISCGILMEKPAFFHKDEKEPIIFIDRIVEIPGSRAGLGAMGEALPIFVDAMIKVIKKGYIKMYNDNPKVRIEVAVDDKRKQFLYEFHKRKTDTPFIHTYRTFYQHGDFGIAERQDFTIAGIKNHTLLLHKKNKALIQDMKVCIKADINKPERKTAGSELYLDRIDSMENSFLSYVNIIIRRKYV